MRRVGRAAASLGRSPASARRTVGAAADGLDRDRLDDQRLALDDEAELRLCAASKAAARVMRRRRSPASKSTGRARCRCRHSGYARARCTVTASPARRPGRRLRFDRVVAEAARRRVAIDGSDRVDRAAARAPAGGWRGCRRGPCHRPTAARERMDQHACHAERIGDQAGMLAAGAAEAVERIAGDVIAALHGDLLDRVRHVLDRDAEEAVGDFLGRAAVADLVRERANASRTASRRAAGRARRRRSSGRNRGSSLPTITLASVTASGPPRR